MDEAFVIMQIGNSAMDEVHDTAIAPAIVDAGLTPRRVDRHNQGDGVRFGTQERAARAPLRFAHSGSDART
jgi:hypothetical protein